MAAAALAGTADNAPTLPLHGTADTTLPAAAPKWPTTGTGILVAPQTTGLTPAPASAVPGAAAMGEEVVEEADARLLVLPGCCATRVDASYARTMPSLQPHSSTLPRDDRARMEGTVSDSAA